MPGVVARETVVNNVDDTGALSNGCDPAQASMVCMPIIFADIIE